MNWFKEYVYADEIKLRFHQLMLLHHPDRGGDTRTCQLIIDQYHMALKGAKKKDPTHGAYTYNEKTESIYEEIIKDLMKYNNLKIEQVGDWLWASTTNPVVEDALYYKGFTYSSKRNKYFWKPDDFVAKPKPRGVEEVNWSFDDMRKHFGSKNLKEQKEDFKL